MRRPAALALAAAASFGCAANRLPPRLADAERRIRPAEVKADVAWLAAPERTGRGVGTPGNAAAAAFIAERMREVGLVPGGDDGYRQPCEAPVGAAPVGENALAVGSAAATLLRSWQPFTFSDNGAVEAELVWAGYGITAAD